MARDPLGLYDDCIVIPFEIPWRISHDPDPEPIALAPVASFAGGAAPQHPAADPPSPANLDRHYRELAAKAANPNWPWPESRLVAADVNGHPSLAISGASDGDVMLWRRSTTADAAQVLAVLRLDLGGSELYAGKRFAGLFYEAEGRATLHPDWLRDIGAVEPDANEPNPEEPTLEEHPEPLQIFPLLPRTPEELEHRHGPAVPVPPFGVPSSRPPGPAKPGGVDSARSGATAASRQFPYGFPNPDAFARFGRQLHAGIEAAGYPDVYAALRGSSITGGSFRTGAPFDAGRRSDLDVSLADPALFQRAKQLGIDLRGGGHRTQPLTAPQLRKLHLLSLVHRLQKQLGRKVSIMVYASPASIDERGPNMPIPR